MSAAAAGAAAAQAAAINAIRSFGVISTIGPEEFLTIVGRQEAPLVVTATGGVFAAEYRYLVSYKGLTFFTKSPYPLHLPSDTEIIQAEKLYLPG
jgi:hypothetical protein